MSTSVALSTPLQKRLSQEVEYRHNITNYDKDNLYPQKVEEIIARSPIAKSASLRLSEFLSGEGWEFNGDMTVNPDGDTLNKILTQITDDDSKFNGWAVHVNVNIIGQITTVKHLPFEYVRYGLPTPSGKHRTVKVSVNWENDATKTTKRGQEKIFTFPLWGEWEEEAPFGYVFYVVPEPDVYPRAVPDAVLDSCQVDYEVQVFELGSIQNGFLGTSIFRYPGNTTESPNERRDILTMLAELQGPTGANGIGYVEISPSFTGPLLENIPANNNDALFNTTTKNVLQRILLTYSMPKSILGIEPDSGMFNIEQVEESYYYYNVRTRRERLNIAAQFNEIMSFWRGGPVELGKIVESSFLPVETEEEIVTENPETNE